MTTELPFEYTPRWQDTDLPLPDELGSVLEDRDRQLEDYLAGLDTGGTATTVEAFCFVVDFTTTTTSETVSLDNSTGSFYTSGVSMSSNTITIPTGVWQVGANVSVDEGSGTPTSGELSLRLLPTGVFSVWEYIGFVDYADVASYSITPTISGSQLGYFVTDPSTITLGSYNGMSHTAYLYGTVWGHQVPYLSTGFTDNVNT